MVLTLSTCPSIPFRNYQVKNATWFCLLALLVLFSGLIFLFRRISKLERLRLDAADVRVKVLNETMQGIKVIKLMGMLSSPCSCDKTLSPVTRTAECTFDATGLSFIKTYFHSLLSCMQGGRNRSSRRSTKHERRNWCMCGASR